MRLCTITTALAAITAAKIITIPAGKGANNGLPPGWKHEKRASPTQNLDLSIELQQPRLAELKQRLALISDPDHAEYSNHLTKDEIEVYQKPNEHAVRSVSSWLQDRGILDTRIEGSSIKFRASVAAARDLFEADVGHYSFERSSIHMRAPSYSLPDHLAGHIRFVHPLSHFAKPARAHAEHRRKVVSQHVPVGSSRRDVVRRHEKYTPYQVAARQDAGNQSQPCPDGVNPDCLRKLYSLPNANRTSSQNRQSKVRFGVAGFLEQYIHYDDVSSFMEKYAPSIQAKGYNFSLSLLNNATNPQVPDKTAGDEASLDLEYAMALGYPTEVKYWLMAGRGPFINANGTTIPSDEGSNEPFLEFLQILIDLPDDEVPHVLSISYGDDEQSVPYDYAHKVCDLFATLSARGTSVLVASGDGGASGTGNGECYSNDGQRRKMFVPVFPASCPYVTAIGATGFSVPLEASLISGGGFSNYFAVPEWQKSAADEYKAALHGAHGGFYNATGRAIPDLSAPGELFYIFSGGEETLVRGTSASTPVVAAMVALVNDKRFKHGKKSLGWLNPTLYRQNVRDALLDVSTGSNTGCIYAEDDIEDGFQAYSGYDCVTGLGTVGKFRDFLRALL